MCIFQAKMLLAISTEASACVWSIIHVHSHRCITGMVNTLKQILSGHKRTDYKPEEAGNAEVTQVKSLLSFLSLFLPLFIFPSPLVCLVDVSEGCSTHRGVYQGDQAFSWWQEPRGGLIGVWHQSTQGNIWDHPYIHCQLIRYRREGEREGGRGEKGRWRQWFLIFL